ncbi:MAG: hypothetical protein QN120_07695 [Armatimonadota bacterium]|nr:hypothetical protein [Armatimonadota bacterium]
MRIVPIRLPTPYPVAPVNVYMLPGPPLTLLDGGPKTPIGHLDLLADEGRPATVRRNGLVYDLIRPAAGSRGIEGDDDGERGG